MGEDGTLSFGSWRVLKHFSGVRADVVCYVRFIFQDEHSIGSKYYIAVNNATLFYLNSLREGFQNKSGYSIRVYIEQRSEGTEKERKLTNNTGNTHETTLEPKE